MVSHIALPENESDNFMDCPGICFFGERYYNDCYRNVKIIMLSLLHLSCKL